MFIHSKDINQYWESNLPEGYYEPNQIYALVNCSAFDEKWEKFMSQEYLQSIEVRDFDPNLEGQFRVEYTMFDNNWTTSGEPDYFDTYEDAVKCADENNSLTYYSDGKNCWYNNGWQCVVYDSLNRMVYASEGQDTTYYPIEDQ